MRNAELIARQVPFLRRYARALTGSQSAGDAHVAATLEALLQDGVSGFAQGTTSHEAKVKLFSLFARHWNRSTAGVSAPAVVSGADRRMIGLASLPRQAFALSAVEGFSEPHGAEILGVSLDEFRRLQDEAARQLAALMATSVLIIEDEPLIAMDIEAIVMESGHRVCGIARTHREAVALCETTRPGLVLADVQLADGSSGLDAVKEILSAFSVPVIFITAFPERLLTGERPEPTFLIAKPFQPAHVAAVIGQALFFEQAAAGAQRADA